MGYQRCGILIDHIQMATVDEERILRRENVVVEPGHFRRPERWAPSGKAITSLVKMQRGLELGTCRNANPPRSGIVSQVLDHWPKIQFYSALLDEAKVKVEILCPAQRDGQ